VFAEERKKKILQLIENEKSVKVADLSKVFNVSEATIRRDLQELEKENLVERTHGGAIKPQKASFELSFFEKEDRYLTEKQAIARKALEYISTGDTILLDSGTTTYQIAKLLRKSRLQISVVTNSIIIGQELMNNRNINLVITGGELRHKTLALVGTIAEDALAKVNVDKVFLACNGIHPEIGLSTHSLNEVQVKKAMINSGGKIIAVADSSKFGKPAFASVVTFDAVDYLITDSKLDKKYEYQIAEKGTKVIKAEI
jgi:DeoR/GlpR family transcriptional regulator of sugar metabolism